LASARRNTARCTAVATNTAIGVLGEPGEYPCVGSIQHVTRKHAKRKNHIDLGVKVYLEEEDLAPTCCLEHKLAGCALIAAFVTALVTEEEQVKDAGPGL